MPLAFVLVFILVTASESAPNMGTSYAESGERCDIEGSCGSLDDELALMQVRIATSSLTGKSRKKWGESSKKEQQPQQQHSSKSNDNCAPCMPMANAALGSSCSDAVCVVQAFAKQKDNLMAQQDGIAKLMGVYACAQQNKCNLSPNSAAGKEAQSLGLFKDAPPSFLQVARKNIAKTTCLNLTYFYAHLKNQKPWRRFSQFYQDFYLTELFDQVGTANNFFVEFGSPQTDGNSSSNKDYMSNTNFLKEFQGWNGLLMDGGFENPKINLRKEWITKDNVVSLFDKYAVPKEADLVSIDIDGCDLWVFYELTRVYRPRVVLVESNPFFSADKAMTEKCGINGAEKPEVDSANHIDAKNSWSSWGFSEMGIYGASRKAFRLAARDRGYTPVILEHGNCEDIFLLRDDLFCDDETSQQTLADLRSNFENLLWLPRCADWRHDVDGMLIHDNEGKRLSAKYLLDFAQWLGINASNGLNRS